MPAQPGLRQITMSPKEKIVKMKLGYKKCPFMTFRKEAEVEGSEKEERE